MTIELYCHHCGQRMEIADQYAGQEGTCKNCGGKIAVPVRATKSQVLPSISKASSAVPYAWVTGTAIAVVILALGIYLFVSHDSSLPAASPKSPGTHRTINFPSDRVVAELQARNVGGALWGVRIADARGPVQVPLNKEVGVWVNQNHAPDLSFLRKLAPDDLSYVMLTRPEISDRHLQNLEHLTGLKSIVVVFCHVTDKGLRSFRGLNQLEFLGLEGTSITDEGLAQLKGLEGLTGLGLGRTKISHRGIQTISSLQTVAWISLDSAALTQPMVDALKEFPKLATLVLDTDSILNEQTFPESHVKLDPAVRTSPENILLLRGIPQLRNLSLRGTLNDDSLIPALSLLTGLEKIEFQGTSVTPEGRNQLRQALPNCKIAP